MISDNRPTSNCDIRFGISGLRNPSLVAEFYPLDIPDDWFLDYYRNEFSLILMNVSELTSHSDVLKPSEGILADAINELYEDIIGDDFTVLLDVSELPETRVKQLLSESLVAEQMQETKTLVFVDLKTVLTTELPTEPPVFSVSLTWHRLPQESNFCLLYCVTAEQAIEPLKLKEMIAQIREHASSEGGGIAYVIFSATQNALENCRNAILLESMM